MPAGISTAKARRNSKTKASACRAKLGLPAKAGKRRPHNIMKDSKGDYIAAPFAPRPRVIEEEKRPFIMDYTVPVNPPGKINYNSLR